jgi:hypothetical protein
MLYSCIRDVELRIESLLISKTKALAYARIFYAFHFNAPYQISPLPNTRPVIVGFTLFEWFMSICLSLFHIRLLFLIRTSFIYVHYFRNKT